VSMTVAALHKRLGALIEAGHGRKPVLVNKASFTHPLEMDGAVMLDIAAIYGPTWIPMADDDGGTKWNKDGSESGKTVVLLSGGDPAGDFAEVAPATTAAAEREEAIEAKAREIYEGWKTLPGWMPWVEGGNSDKQREARQLAAAALDSSSGTGGVASGSTVGDGGSNSKQGRG
jgi:hypothetical protein